MPGDTKRRLLISHGAVESWENLTTKIPVADSGGCTRAISTLYLHRVQVFPKGARVQLLGPCIRADYRDLLRVH